MTDAETTTAPRQPAGTIPPDDPFAAAAEPGDVDAPTPAAPEPEPEPAPAAFTTPPTPGPANPSPDGATVAYLQPNADGTPRLWLAPVAGEPPRALALEPAVELVADDPDAGPQWSPNGDTLAVVGRHPDGGGTVVWLIDAATGRARPQRPADHPRRDRSPRRSPDGALMAVITSGDGRDALAIVPAAGGPEIRLTDGRRDVREPEWSPDGARIAYVERSVDDEQAAGVREDIGVATLATGETKRLTSKPSPGRRSPRWARHRPLIAFASDEREWTHIAVVNPDNAASWTMASEAGDKAEPHWSPAGKLLYTRTEGNAVRVCARMPNAARGEPLDPGNGVASTPRWRLVPGAAPAAPPAAQAATATAAAGDNGDEDDDTGDEEAAEDAPAKADGVAAPAAEEFAVYAFAAPDRAPTLIVQAPTPDAERVELTPAAAWSAPAAVPPTSLEFLGGHGAKLGGLLYRRAESAGPAPGVLLVDDLPFGHRAAAPAPPAQALAAAGLAVFAPHLPGATGLGRKVADGLRAGAEVETEIGDLADAATALGGVEGVSLDRLAVVGHGYGGTLALLLTGGRPGIVQAAVTIDPIADWALELDRAPAAARAWIVRQFGLPAAGAARYALRTPATFAAPIDVPLLLIGTAGAAAWRAEQLDALAATLAEVGVVFEREEVAGDPSVEPYRRAAAFLTRHFRR